MFIEADLKWARDQLERASMITKQGSTCLHHRGHTCSNRSGKLVVQRLHRVTTSVAASRTTHNKIVVYVNP